MIVMGLIFNLCSCRHDGTAQRHINIQQAGWSFAIPEDIGFADSSFDAKGNILKGYQKSMGLDSLPLFEIVGKHNNVFRAALIKDTSGVGEWQEKIIVDHHWYVAQLSQLEKTQILDTSFTTERIDNVKFYKEYIKVYRETSRDTISEYHFTAKFRPRELTINLTSSNGKWKDIYLKIVQSSRFSLSRPLDFQ